LPRVSFIACCKCTANHTTMPKQSDHTITKKRYNWGKEYSVLPKLDLLAIQKQSYKLFLEKGIAEILQEISPVEDFTGKNWTLAFHDHKLGQTSITPEIALYKGLTYSAPLTATVTLINKKTEETHKAEVFLGDIPQMTTRGTFIVNGIERAVVNQLVRSPGVFFIGNQDPITGKTLYSTEIRPVHGSWLEFATTRYGTITVKIDRRRKFFATTFLRALGFSDNEALREQFKNLAGEDGKVSLLENTLQKDDTTNETEALVEIFKKMHPGEPVVLDKVKEYFANLFFNNRRYDLGEVGRYKINKRLQNVAGFYASEERVLTIQDIISTIFCLMQLEEGKGDTDDIDSLSNRRVRSVGELVATNAFRVGVLRVERSIKERMSLLQADIPVTVGNLINARPIMAAINEFFRTSQLSTILDQTNPLSEIDNLNRLTVMGTGGISRERAAFSIRDINSSQYSRICPVRSPEGPNIGLVTYMALFSRVNQYGFLEAPYLKVVKEKKGNKTIVKVTDEVVYMTADDERNHYITHASIAISEKGELEEERVPVRYKGDYFEIDRESIEYIDVAPRQVVGTSASLIPFIGHDEANRALMGTHMQCQAVPLINPQSPTVGTGMEGAIAEVMGRVVKAPFDGKVLFVDSTKLTLERKDGEKVTFPITTFERTSQATAYTQRPLVKQGQTITTGDILIDGPSAQNGELALGRNLLIAYASLDGLGYEDAIVISDKLVKENVLSSIHIEKYEAAVVETKLGPEETTRDIPNVSEEDLADLDEEGIVVLGSEVGPGSILVGKIAPKGETELTAEERLLRAIFGEQAREVRDTSLRMPHGERGTVINIQILDRKSGDELEPGTMRKIIVEVAQLRHVSVGDKLAGRHGNKGIISRILPVADMPCLADGTPIDIIISPVSILARMNLGQILEAHLGFAAEKLNMKIGVPAFEKIDEANIVSLLRQAGLSVTGKSQLYDGKTGKAFENPVVVGIEYIMKLIHMVEDKTHARSTGPYSLVTQQPLGGKAQMGGQRLGEMEVWALESHRARYILQEMLTLKSDDVVGRAKAFEAIVKGTDIPTPKVPESFKVLIKELQSLSLNVVPTEAIEYNDAIEAKAEESAEEVKEEVKALEESLEAEEVIEEPITENVEKEIEEKTEEPTQADVELAA
jgi:DNA-directed RNA polymerase subunit beta